MITTPTSIASISTPESGYAYDDRPLTTSDSLDSARFYSYDDIPANLTSANDSETSHYFLTASTAHPDSTLTHYYYGRRFHSPALGRWLSRDPVNEQGSTAVMQSERRREEMIERVSAGEYDNLFAQVLEQSGQGGHSLSATQAQSLRTLIVEALSQVDSEVFAELPEMGARTSWSLVREGRGLSSRAAPSDGSPYAFVENQPTTQIDPLGLFGLGWCQYRCGPVKPYKKGGVFGQILCDYKNCPRIYKACICGDCPQTTDSLAFPAVCLPMLRIPIPICFCPGGFPVQGCK